MAEPKLRALPPPPVSQAPARPSRPSFPKPPPPRILHRDKDIAARYAKSLEALRGHSQCLAQNVHRDPSSGRFTKDFLEHLGKANAAFRDMRGILWPRYPIEVAHAYRRDVAEILHERGVVDKVLCQYAVELLPDRAVSGDRKTVLECCMKMLLDYSDCSPDVCMDMAEHPRFLKMAAEFLRSSPEKSDSFQEKMQQWTLYHVFNIARVRENTPRLKEEKILGVASTFLRSSKPYLRLAALGCLAFLAEDEECHVFQTNADSIDFLLKTLRETMRNSTLQKQGWNRRELAEVVGQLARNEANRKLLVQRGCLPLLADLANVNDPLDEKAALTSLWHLVLEVEENRKAVLKQWNLIPIVVDKCRHHQDPQVRHLASGILWDMRKELEADPRHKDIVPQMRKQASEFQMQQTVTTSPGKGTSGQLTVWESRDKSGGENGVVALPGRVKVMLSYNHKHGDIAQMLYAFLLDSGFDVWFDKENMSGCIVKAMAEAIESANVVCICFSAFYKDSPNCESEALYAREQGKPIVPIKVQRDYKPSGWLGFILTQKLFFDFTGKYSIEEKKKELLKELQRMVEKKKK